jgi:precorrin-2 dehydrogenase/sirohydrochlorin ferrochelatase
VSGGVPLVLHVRGRLVVGVGAGPVAAGKLLPLLSEGARLVVVAPKADDPIRSAAAEGLLDWRRRPYREGDLAGAVLAVAATALDDVNAAVQAEADAAGVPCVRVDAGGSADFMAAVRRGPLLLAASTGGAAPALAARVRERLEDDWGPEWGALAGLLGELRSNPEVRARLGALPPGIRRLKWRSILDTNILTLLRAGEAQAARELAFACLSSSSD